jgi:hypothetical protein
LRCKIGKILQLFDMFQLHPTDSAKTMNPSCADRSSYVGYDHVGFVMPKKFRSFRCGHSFADLVRGVGSCLANEFPIGCVVVNHKNLPGIGRCPTFQCMDVAIALMTVLARKPLI